MELEKATLAMECGSSGYLIGDPLVALGSPYVGIIVLRRGLSVSVLGSQKVYEKPATISCIDTWDCVIITIDRSKAGSVIMAGNIVLIGLGNKDKGGMPRERRVSYQIQI